MEKASEEPLQRHRIIQDKLEVKKKTLYSVCISFASLTLFFFFAAAAVRCVPHIGSTEGGPAVVSANVSRNQFFHLCLF